MKEQESEYPKAEYYEGKTYKTFSSLRNASRHAQEVGGFVTPLFELKDYKTEENDKGERKKVSCKPYRERTGEYLVTYPESLINKNMNVKKGWL